MPATASRRDFLKGLAGAWAVAVSSAVVGWRRLIPAAPAPAPRRLDPPEHSVKRHA